MGLSGDDLEAWNKISGWFGIDLAELIESTGSHLTAFDDVGADDSPDGEDLRDAALTAVQVAAQVIDAAGRATTRAQLPQVRRHLAAAAALVRRAEALAGADPAS